MLAFIARRLSSTLAILFIGLTLTFFILHWAPGDPASRFLFSSMDPAAREAIVQRFGLDQSIGTQYAKWLQQVIWHRDFGNSFHSGRPATHVIAEVLPYTLLISGTALLLGFGLGLLLGVVSALRKNTALDRTITALVLFFYSMPTFLIGLFLLSVFAIRLDWLPASQIHSVFYTDMGFWGRLGDTLRHMLLPVATLALTLAATFYRYSRDAMIRILHSEYMLAARARGLRQRQIIWKYGLRNSLIPLISQLGLVIPMLFSGVVVIEVLFSLPGMGRVMLEAVLAQDYPVIMAASMIAFLVVIGANFLADIGYALADPRVRLEGSK